MSTNLTDPGAAFMEATANQEPGGDPAAAEAPEAPDTPAEPAPAAQGDDAKAQDTDRGPVPWGEHKKAQDEAARYRTQLRSYEQAFEGWAPDDAKVLLQAVQVSAQLVDAGRPQDAARIWQEVAKVLGPEAAEQVQDAATGDGGDDEGDELLTRAQMEALLAERDQHVAFEQGVAREMQQIQQVAAELGFDPQSEEWAVVLSEAVNLHDGDVRAAAEAVKARTQAAIDAYLAGKQETARRTPRVASGRNPAPASEAPKDFGEARDALAAFLDTQQ